MDARLKEELTVGITLANIVSSQDASHGRSISTNVIIRNAMDDELVSQSVWVPRWS